MSPRRRPCWCPWLVAVSAAFFGAVGATALKALRPGEGRDLRVAREEVLQLAAKEEAVLEHGASADVLGQQLAVSMAEPVEVGQHC